MDDLKELLGVGDVRIMNLKAGRYMVSVYPPGTRCWFYATGDSLEEALANTKQKAVEYHWITVR